MKVRKIRDHFESEWGGHAMVLIGRREAPYKWRTHVWRDRLGRANGSTTMWHVAICNNPQCPAEMLVQFDDEVRQAAILAGLHVRGESAGA